MIYFRDFKHIYFDKDNRKYLSVTTFLKNFKETFEEDYWLNYKALEAIRNDLKKDAEGNYVKMPGFYGKVVGKNIMSCVKKEELDLHNQIKHEIKQMWASNNTKATEFGTSYHKMQETRDLKNSEVINPYDNTIYPVIPAPDCPEDNCTRKCDMVGCYLELLIHDEEMRMAGQADKVFIVNEEGEFDIRDYKTNGKLDFTSYKHKKMKAPFDELDDCSYMHYCLQLSIYAYMLERQGFKCRKLYIDFYEKPIEAIYFKTLIQKAFEIRKEQLSLAIN